MVRCKGLLSGNLCPKSEFPILFMSLGCAALYLYFLFFSLIPLFLGIYSLPLLSSSLRHILI